LTASSRPQVVFVAGLHRSGTSIISRCIAGHPDVSGLAATGASEDEGQHLQSVYPTAAAHGGPGRFAFSPAAHLTERSVLVSVANRHRLLAEWGRYWDRDRPVLLEKSPPNLIRTRFLQALFPEASFVIVLRHPAVVALATRGWVPDPLEALLKHWFHAHALLAQDLSRIRRALVVRYESLVADPRSELDRVGSFLGLESLPDAGIEPDRSQRHWSEWAAQVDERAGDFAPLAPLAGLFGYDLFGAPAPSPAMVAAR
jgi:hypothetical protein